MSEAPERARQAALGHLLAVVERWSAELAVGEEPSGFLAALAAGAPPVPAAPPPAPRPCDD